MSRHFALSLHESTNVSKSSLRLRVYVSEIVCAVVITCVSALSQTATTTSLTVTSGGNQVSSVAAGSMITLTASVTAGSVAVKQGQVNFCDATASYCTDIHLLGTTQLNSSGEAQMYLRPGKGSYSYKAVFTGTPNATVPYAGSASSSSSLTVTGQPATATTITQSGVSGNYTLTASVFGFAKSQSLAAPTGSVSFLDTTTNNSSLGMDSLTPVSGPGWVNVSKYESMGNTIVQLRGPFCSGSMAAA